MTPALRNQLIALSHNEALSERFRLACRVELGDVPTPQAPKQAGTS